MIRGNAFSSVVHPSPDPTELVAVRCPSLSFTERFRISGRNLLYTHAILSPAIVICIVVSAFILSWIFERLRKGYAAFSLQVGLLFSFF